MNWSSPGTTRGTTFRNSPESTLSRMTKLDLKELIPFLRESGVNFFRQTGENYFEIGFFSPRQLSKSPPQPQKSAESGLKIEKIEDVVVPQSLDEEPSMTVDKILNWSVESEGSVPLTGAGESNGR
jgi:hypothetical protein